MLPSKDIKVECTEDRPASGMWHCGPNPAWVTVTHLPTMISARAYHRSHHKAMRAAMTCVEMLLEEAQVDKCHFSDRLTNAKLEG